MDDKDYMRFFDELDDHEQMEDFIDRNKRPRRLPGRNPKKPGDADRRFLSDQSDARGQFKFTYKAARFEEWWLLESLGDFYEHRWIADVLRKIKGGKEASVYQCLAGPGFSSELVAAKVYRPRSLRNLKNDGAYRAGRADLTDEGKQVLDDGMLHAMRKRTEYGRELLHQSWIAYEFTSLQRLHAAGADVPEPHTMAQNAILMGFMGDRDGPAPALSEVTLEPAEAKTLFERVIYNIDLMLAHDLIHGDLSAYNILYWDRGITLIDFPQVVAPQANASAFGIFKRDVSRVCEYFARQAVRVDAKKLAAELWTSHGHPLVAEVQPQNLDADKPEDRMLWERQRSQR